MGVAIPPCEEGVIRRTDACAPCERSSEPWVIAAAGIGSGMAFLDSTVLNVALPAIQIDLGASAQGTQWVYGAYALVIAAFLLVGGALGDRFGRRRIFALGVGLFGAASVWCAMAPGVEQLIVARAAQGVGGALMVPGALAIIGASFREERRARAIGAWSAISGLAMAVGPVLGGLLVENVSWRAVFLINPPLAAAVILIALRHVPESRDPGAGRLDLSGAALATLGLGGLVYGLIRSSGTGLGDPLSLASFALGAAGLAAFLLVEGRGRQPMMPLSLFRSKTFDGASLYTLLFYVALTGSLYFVPFLLMQIHGHPATVAGLVFLPFVAAALLLGRFSGRIVGRYGTKKPLAVAALAAAAGFALFALPGVEGTPHWEAFVPAMLLQGFGMALAIAPLTTAALDSVEGDHAGLASGVNNAVCRTAGLLAVAAFGVVVFAVFSSGLDARVSGLDLSPAERAALDAEKADLGAAQAPPGVDAGTASQIERAVSESFVESFRIVMLVAAGLAVASAFVAWSLIEVPYTPGPASAVRSRTFSRMGIETGRRWVGSATQGKNSTEGEA